MIKARGTMDGKPLMLLGLSRENINRLVQDKPISFDGSDLDFYGTIMIIFGETEEAIAEALGETLGEEK